jgi:hypothetical protein
MSKRFTDTEKWGKLFFRGIKGPYKLLFIYVCDRCDHAGIWHVNFEVAQIEIGKDMRVNQEEALRLFGGRVFPFSNGEKWFIPGFIEMQYGDLQERNRAHASVIARLKKYDLWDEERRTILPPSKVHISPLEGHKDKEIREINKSLNTHEENRGLGEGEGFSKFWEAYPKKVSIGQAERAWRKLKPTEQLFEQIMTALQRAKTLVWVSTEKRFIPNPATWLNGKGWLDEVVVEDGLAAFKRIAEDELQREKIEEPIAEPDQEAIG